MKKTELQGKSKAYRIIVVVLLVLLVLFFLFPLYWIVTGSFKTRIEITAREPVWFPVSPTLDNYARLFSHPAWRWLFNIVFISFAAMVLTCVTSALAGASCLPSSSAPWPCPSRSSSSRWRRK